MNVEVGFKLSNLVSIAPAIFLFVASLIPLTIKVLRGNTEPHPLVALTYVWLGALAAIATGAIFYARSAGGFFAFENALVIDGLSAFSTLIISTVTAVAATMAYEHNATNGRQFSEFLFLLLNAAIGMLILVWSNDLIVTFIGIEMMSLCLYLLIALSHEERLSKEAAFKYFVLGSFASAIFLFGIAFIYGLSGTTYISKLVELGPKLVEQNMLFVVGMALAIIGFCFKVAIVPFHAWAPDVYEGAPTPVTAFMATGVKAATFVAFLRLINLEFLHVEMSGELLNILQWLAVITMTVGNLAAVVQNSLKRMLAYSSVAHGGYVMMGLIAAGVGENAWLGNSGVLYYMLAYTIMTLGAFGVVTLLERRENDIVLVDELRGLGKRRPWAAAAFSIFMLSLAGIPPTVGFFGKFFLFSAAVKQGFFWMAIWGALNSVISAYYYLRPIVLMYMRDETGVDVAAHYRLSKVLVAGLAVLTIVVGVCTDPIYKFILAAIDSFMGA